MKIGKLVILIVMIILLVLQYTHLFFLNVYTHSLPYGIYIRKAGEPHIGDYAITCLTREVAAYGLKRGYLAPGNCDTGSIAVGKIIKGIPGDQYSIKSGILFVDGAQYPIYSIDSNGRPLVSMFKSSMGKLEKDQYILISTFAKNSWDSRYWGPVPIKFIVQPLWIFENGRQT